MRVLSKSETAAEDALELIERAQEAFVERLAGLALQAAAPGFERYPQDAAALLLVEAPVAWMKTLHCVAKRLTGCTPVRLLYTSIGTRAELKQAEDHLTTVLAQGKSAAVLAHSLDDLPRHLRAVADHMLRIAPPTVEHLLTAADEYGLPIAASDLADVDMAMLTPSLVEAAWRTPLPSKNADRLLRALRAASSKSTTRGLTFDDLPGLGDAAAWGRRLARDLADYRAGRLAWTDVDAGLLLSGPPGVGKTRFAQALAAECGVPLVQGSLAVWQSAGHLGDLLREMAATFAQAKAKVPCILFVDEMDSFGDRRAMGDQHRDYSTQVVNALLEHLDGVGGREGVVVVAATNHPRRLDPALRRAGRLDRHLRLGLPDASARAAILAHYSGLPPADLAAVAHRTDGASGAELEAVARDARRLARDEGAPLGILHLLTAAYARRSEAITASVDLANLEPLPGCPVH